MTLFLSDPPPNYSQTDEGVARRAIKKAIQEILGLILRKDRDLTFSAQTVTFAENRVILTSPNGTRYYLTVSNAGVLGTTAV